MNAISGVLVWGVGSILTASVLCLGADLSGAARPEMLLCVDSISIVATTEKMVYGYINGVKTQCMPEYRFLELYSQSVFDDSVMTIADSLNPCNRADSSDPMARIARGDRLLQCVNLAEADLMGLNLSGADLRRANLFGADLRNANLCGARLQDADLKKVCFKNANLTKTNFKGASLSGADFRGADLRGARDLTREQLKGAKSLYKAKLDDRLRGALQAENPEKFGKPDTSMH